MLKFQITITSTVITMRKQIMLSLILLMFVGQCFAKSTYDGTNIEVPFVFEKGLVIVEAKIKGNIPVRVALATGVEHSVTDLTLLEKYKLSALYAADGPVTGRNDKTYTFTKVPGVSVGNSKSKELNMRFGLMSQVSSLLGYEIFATLGADFFEDQIVQFDFKKSVIRFMDRLPPGLESQNPRPAVAEPIVLRMASKPSDPFRKTYLMPRVREIQFNGKKGSLLIDTGTATSLGFSSSAAQKVGFAVPSENGPPIEKTVSLRYESFEINDVQAMIYAKGTSADQRLSKEGVVAGSVFLNRFVVLFDFKKGRIFLE